MFPNSSSSDVCVEETKDIIGGDSVTFKRIRSGQPVQHTHLAELLINNPELEVVADHVLVKGDDEPRGLRTREEKGLQ